ncbi:MAG: hypothetical protein DI616_01250 [Paracoccus denitrificans]|uniref:SWIM-type domain-containing protein n=1 Tax=Paracoccus denitrificans TaxID=266 RepID=A0A533IET8_PARDE|nr:MAG: hypothetical protein DI616_01250 [Paracoccus denitrificans]
MSALGDFLVSLDEPALIAAANKGVVIRARKDAAAGKVALKTEDQTTALLSMDADEITLDARGLTACRCTCPAPGLCRHQVTSILFLRDRATAETPAASEQGVPPPPVFTLDEIARFARADWPLALAICDEPFAIETGASTTVRFAETGESVTFLAGRPLAEALFKGPRSSRQRRVVAAAALILLRDAGTALPDVIAPDTVRAAATPRLLDLSQAALRQAAAALAAGQVIEAGNRLFTLAISARTEAVPRLAGALRALSERLDPDRLRRAQDRPEDILAALSNAYALTEALRHAPSDPSLTGVHARNFSAQGARDLVYIGAEHWRSDAGARGLTGYLFDPHESTFHRATEARPAGIDPNFSGRERWDSTIWSAGTPRQLGGATLSFPDLAMAPDGAISLSQNASRTGPTTAASLIGHPATQRNWNALWDYLQASARVGLRRDRAEALALIAPDRVEEAEFDPLTQRDIWYWMDPEENALPLSLPGEADGIRLLEPALGLAAFGAGALPRLIAYWPKNSDKPLSLHDPHLRWNDLMKSTAGKRDAPVIRPTATFRHDNLERWFDHVMEAILSRLGHGARHWRPDLARDAETLGFQTIASAIAASEGASLTVDQGLRLAYLVDQSRRLSR